MKSQMFKLDLENAEDPETKLPTSAGSSKKQEFQKNIYFCSFDYTKAFDCVNHNKLWKTVKEMGIPDHLICLLRNCKQVKKQQLDLDMKQQTNSKSERSMSRLYIVTCLFNLYTEYIMQNARLEHRLEARLPGKI